MTVLYLVAGLAAGLATLSLLLAVVWWVLITDEAPRDCA
jgi:hypothetical protein